MTVPHADLLSELWKKRAELVFVAFSSLYRFEISPPHIPFFSQYFHIDLDSFGLKNSSPSPEGLGIHHPSPSSKAFVWQRRNHQRCHSRQQGEMEILMMPSMFFCKPRDLSFVSGRDHTFVSSESPSNLTRPRTQTAVSDASGNNPTPL